MEKEEMMISDEDAFEKSGLTHLSSADWTSSEYRRIVAASLVQGTYAMERDRGRTHALAPQWSSFFHFQLIEELADKHKSIFGAIFEYKPPCQLNSASVEHAPKFVVAFRGSFIKRPSVGGDLILDLNIFLHRLHKRSRCNIAKVAVEFVVDNAGNSSKIWLAGHSLGASVATVVGKAFAEKGILLESFLFNPPFVSAPTNMISNVKLKSIGREIKTSVVASLDKDEGSSSVDSSETLSSWIPHLFVNRKDFICSGYIGYFEHRQTAEGLAARQSIRATIQKVFGKKPDMVHLLPSATLIINKSHTNSPSWAHGIRQWCRQDMDLNQNKYM